MKHEIMATFIGVVLILVIAHAFFITRPSQ